MLCRICNSSTRLAFTHKVLSKYDCGFYFCDNCGGLQTENPHWLDEAYASPVASADTGILWRNLYLARVTSVVLFFLFDRHGRFLDAAGGYGIFTRLMRDVGFDYYWTDKYCPNLTARGFEAEVGPGGPYTAVTAFEVMEHLPDPVAFVAELLESTGTDTIIFTTRAFRRRASGAGGMVVLRFRHRAAHQLLSEIDAGAHRKALRHALLQLRHAAHLDTSETQSAGLARAHLARCCEPPQRVATARAWVPNHGGP